jgi:hypothetical protein
MSAALRHAVALALLAAGAWGETVGDGIVRLENRRVVVEVAPALAGRIVSLRRPDGPNLLAFSPALLQAGLDALPKPAADGPFLPCNGHVVWVGPQREWWSRQDADPQRRDGRATWPPDPWLEYDAMRVVERDGSHVILLGSASPVTGLRLRLQLAIGEDGSVLQVIEAENATLRTVAWDLWPNTRVRGDARVYAPYEPGSRLRLEHTTSDPEQERQLTAAVSDGYLSFDIALPPERLASLHTGKAFLASARPRLFAAVGQDLLIVAASGGDAALVHPDHAAVEVFQCIGGDPARAVLELEFHGPYRTLAPGEAMRFAVAWGIASLPGSPGAEAIRAHEGEALRLGDLAAKAVR